MLKPAPLLALAAGAVLLLVWFAWAAADHAPDRNAPRGLRSVDDASAGDLEPQLAMTPSSAGERVAVEGAGPLETPAGSETPRAPKDVELVRVIFVELVDATGQRLSSKADLQVHVKSSGVDSTLQLGKTTFANGRGRILIGDQRLQRWLTDRTRIAPRVEVSAGGKRGCFPAMVDLPLGDLLEVATVDRARAMEAEAPRLDLRIEVVPAITLEGRVVDQAGHGVRATVRGARTVGPDDGQFHVYLKASADAEGRFRVQLANAGTFDFTAEPHPDSQVAGVAQVEGLHVVAGVTPAPIELRFRGDAELVGRVVDAEGRPRPNASLWVLHAEVDPAPALLDGIGYAVLDVPVHLEAAGKLRGTARTRDDGSFRIAGLVPGHYDVWLDSPNWPTPPRLLTEDPVLADGYPKELVDDGLALVVQVVDRLGLPIPLAEQSSSRGIWNSPYGWHGNSCESGVSVFATSAPDVVPLHDVAPTGVESLVLIGTPDGPAATRFELPGPGRYDVLVAIPGRAPSWHGVETTSTTGTELLEVMAHHSAGVGTLKLTAEGPRGEDLHTLRVEVYLEQGRLPVEVSTSDGHQVGLGLPAGHYRVEVQDWPATGSQHGTVYEHKRFGRAVCDVVIRAGETETVALTLEAGARLEVELPGELESSVQLRSTQCWTDVSERCLEHDHGPESTLVLWDSSQRPLGVEFFLEDNPSLSPGHLGGFPFTTIGPGMRLVSQVVPPGSYELVEYGAGKVRSRQTVELYPGTTTRVRLRR